VIRRTPGRRVRHSPPIFYTEIFRFLTLCSHIRHSRRVLKSDAREIRPVIVFFYFSFRFDISFFTFLSIRILFLIFNLRIFFIFSSFAYYCYNSKISIITISNSRSERIIIFRKRILYATRFTRI